MTDTNTWCNYVRSLHALRERNFWIRELVWQKLYVNDSIEAIASTITCICEWEAVIQSIDD